MGNVDIDHTHGLGVNFPKDLPQLILRRYGCDRRRVNERERHATS